MGVQCALCSALQTFIASPVLEIGFGPPTAKAKAKPKNLKNHVNLDLGDLFLGPQPFGPP